MATNQTEVSKVEFRFNRNCTSKKRVWHTINYGKRSWKFAVYRESAESGKDYVSLTSIASYKYSRVPNQDFHAKIEIINLKGISFFSLIGKWSVGDKKWTQFCNWTNLSENQGELTPDGNFKAILSVGPLIYLTPASSDVVVLSVPRDKSPVESFKSMLDNGTLTDVVIKTSKKSFPCHKLVLAASSVVFKTMFEIEMKESAVNVVNFEGIFNAGTVKDLLHYIYTKQTPPNIGTTCSTLFMAAEYLQLPELKAICEEKLCTMIRVENAADFLQLAEKYSADALKKTAVNFIMSHYKDVMNTPGWKEIPDDMTRY